MSVPQRWASAAATLHCQPSAQGNVGSDVSSPEISLAHLHHDLLILGHGNYGDRIQKDAGYTHSARSLARLLEKRGLPKAFAGKVILWSCFGGAAAGMAQSLTFKLSCRGYTNVQVGGCRWITGTIVNRVLLCRRNTTPENIAGVDAPAAMEDMMRYCDRTVDDDIGWFSRLRRPLRGSVG
ncbi:hypothetical protein [Massilia sp. TWP1-3-3]|uniref:hypothetical protein n=1 Tax=Massilia sp. TWP1-3-3 TaxID=2804573 RepID=UPI003CF65C43